MNLLGTKAWMWINGITLIIVGAISLVPEIAQAIPGIPLSIVKIIVAMITLVVAFLENDIEMLNGKIWLLAIGLILLFMGIFPFFPDAMAAIPQIGDFLNTLKVVLGGITFLIMVLEWSKWGP
ncbi:MAG: membrane protein of unknown function [Candidatus Thorarchaeota archaeon]|nr:MAG: membrane protein of unknown function [Candidatus Thorarchaeota archaeon]